MKRDFVSTREAAKFLGMTQATISRLIRKGKLEGQKLGGFFVVSWTSVEHYATLTDGKGKNDPTRKLERKDQAAG